MGAALSSNVAQATSEVSNAVTDTTAVNTYQLNQQHQSTQLWNCIIKLSEDFNFNAVATTDLRNQQIVKVNSQTNFNTNLQQSVLQQAISKVGSMGVGFAQATNNTSLFCSISNDIINSVNTAATQFSSQGQSFNCANSTIIARNMNINFNSSTEFYNKQILDNSNISQVTNKISQSITQKASATVQGLAGFLIGLALVIAAMGYTIAKPLSSGSIKIVIFVLLILVLIGIGIWLYLAKAPPFFNDPIEVAVHSNLNPEGCDDLINPQLKPVNVDKSPLRYKFAISSLYNNPEPIPDDINLIGLATVASAGSKANNAGFTMASYNKIDSVLTELNKKLKLLQPIKDDVDMENIMNITIPNMLVNPLGNTSGKMLLIPPQFLLESGSGDPQDNKVGLCTPGTFIWNPNNTSTGPPSTWQKCPTQTGTSWGPLQQSDYTTNPLLAVANSNIDEVNSWMANVVSIDKMKGEAYIRFILTYILNESMPSGSKLDLNVYQQDWELVSYQDSKTKNWNIDFASKVSPDVLQKFTINTSTDFGNGSDAGGSITLLLGICNNRQYKFKQWVNNVGKWILLGLIGIIVIVIVMRTLKVKSKSKSKN